MKKTEIQRFHIPADQFRVGVISDSQLPATPRELRESDVFRTNLKKAMTVFRERNTGVILFAGDIGDLGTRFAFQTYMDVVEEVFAEKRPIIQTIMGNHDYWSRSAFSWIPHRRAFRKIVGVSPWTHYEINGYHFIGASPDCGHMTDGYRRVQEWLEREIESAEAESQGRPVFVMTHNQPADTSYGSEDWGDVGLHQIFSRHPSVVNFSGHVHYSLLDERSIWQGAYTVLNTQSLSYTELEPGKENGTIPPNADRTPMGYLLEFGSSAIDILRIGFSREAIGTEEKADRRWSLPLPYLNDGRYAFQARSRNNQAPYFVQRTGTAVRQEGSVRLEFPAAYDDDFVHSYKVVTDGERVQYYFSDFYNGTDRMQKTVSLTIQGIEHPDRPHRFQVFAVDSWGAESAEELSIVLEGDAGRIECP